MSSAFFSIANQLNFVLEDWPEPLKQKACHFLQHFRSPPSSAPLRLQRQQTLNIPPDESFILQEGPLRVFRQGRVLSFVLPGIHAQVDAFQKRVSLALRPSWRDWTDAFVSLTLPSLLCELGASAGLFAIHAAAIVCADQVLLLPAASGSGKSTTARNCYLQGMEVLSDDLNWLREGAEGFHVWAFPRGGLMESLPFPQRDGLRLHAIVCPSIVSQENSQLRRASLPEVLPVVLQEGAFLSGQELQAQRFSALVRAARSVPLYQLEAGADYSEAVPDLLKALPFGL